MVLASSHLLIPVSDDFHFHVLAFLQGLSTCFHQNLDLHTQKIQIDIRTMCDYSTVSFSRFLRYRILVTRDTFEVLLVFLFLARSVVFKLYDQWRGKICYSEDALIEVTLIEDLLYFRRWEVLVLGYTMS